MGSAPEDTDEEEKKAEALSKENNEALKAMGNMSGSQGPERQLDENKAKQAMSDLAKARQADLDAARQREKELAAVKIDKSHIDVIALEMEVDKKLAERRLREHGGDLKSALESLM